MASVLRFFASLLLWTAVDCLQCPADWISPPDSVSCYKVVEEQMSWHDARNYCQSLSGDLMTIESIREHIWIASVTEKGALAAQQFWIGLSKSEGGTWSWVDGTIIQIPKQENATTEDREKHRHDCATLDKHSQEISDAGGCDIEHVKSLVCEAEIGSGSTCPDFWLKRHDSLSCYLLNTDNDGVTWNEAREYCQAKGGDLVVINSVDEKEWLSLAMKKVWPIKTWIGLINEGEGWKWTDGTSLDTSILSWREGSLREHDTGNMEFAFIIAARGQVRATFGPLELGFICEVNRAHYTIACDAPPVPENQEVVFCFKPDGTQVPCHHNLHVPWSAAVYKCKEPYHSTTGLPFAYSYCNSNQKWDHIPAFKCQ